METGSGTCHKAAGRRKRVGAAVDRVRVVVQRDGYANGRKGTRFRDRRGRTVGLAMLLRIPLSAYPIESVRS